MARLRCRKYAIITAYLALQAPWTRTLRELSEAGGEIVFKDEVTRRIVVRASKTKIPSIISVLANRSHGVAVEVKAACRPASGASIDKLVEEGFLLVPQKRAPVYYGVAEDRIVMVEKAKGSIIVKVGAKARSKPKSVPPASSFILSPDEVGEALDALDKILSRLKR